MSTNYKIFKFFNTVILVVPINKITKYLYIIIGNYRYEQVLPKML